jgi:hypothetical protein
MEVSVHSGRIRFNPLGDAPPLLIERSTVWTSQPVWTLWKNMISYRGRESSHDSSAD